MYSYTLTFKEEVDKLTADAEMADVDPSVVVSKVTVVLPLVYPPA